MSADVHECTYASTSAGTRTSANAQSSTMSNIMHACVDVRTKCIADLISSSAISCSSFFLLAIAVLPGTRCSYFCAATRLKYHSQENHDYVCARAYGSEMVNVAGVLSMHARCACCASWMARLNGRCNVHLSETTCQDKRDPTGGHTKKIEWQRVQSPIRSS